eukprot:5796186-Amphidinium_carterae.1
MSDQYPNDLVTVLVVSGGKCQLGRFSRRALLGREGGEGTLARNPEEHAKLDQQGQAKEAPCRWSPGGTRDLADCRKAARE